jgi:hypothetical protein
MDRINYPTDFAGQQDLFTAIFKQHNSLGTKSPLIAFAKQKNMDLTKLQAAIAAAAAQDVLQASLKRSSENSTEQRNLNFSMPWVHQLGEVHFLAGFFAGNERELGEWGVRVDGERRIVYPVSFPEKAQLINVFLEKHNSYPPGESPLQIYIDEHEINVTDDLKAVGAALQNDADSKQQESDSELATQMRNKLWAPAVDAIHLFGAFLMGLYGEDSRKMQAWGYDVVADAASEREQESTLNPLEERTQKSVVIPSVFVNMGEDDLQVWKGAKKKGDAMVVKPGGQLGMTKGYSTIVVYNPSSLVVGKYKVLVSK